MEVTCMGMAAWSLTSARLTGAGVWSGLRLNIMASSTFSS